MNRFKEQLNKPITWGGYLKFSVGCAIISMIYTIYVYWQIGLLKLKGFDKVKDKIGDIKEKVGTTYFERE